MSKTITQWEVAKHKPTGTIFIVTKLDRGCLFDHHGIKYDQKQCDRLPIHCGQTSQQIKQNKPEFSPLKECWKRAKIQAWDGCELKVGDIVSPKYGKQAGQHFTIQLFDHSDRTIGINNFEYWYPEKYLITDRDRHITLDMFDGDKVAFERYSIQSIKLDGET